MQVVISPPLVDPPHGAAIQLVGSGDQEKTGVQGFQNNNTLACKYTSVRIR